MTNYRLNSLNHIDAQTNLFIRKMIVMGQRRPLKNEKYEKKKKKLKRQQSENSKPPLFNSMIFSMESNPTSKYLKLFGRY